MSKSRRQPLDRLAQSLMVVLAVVIVGMVLLGGPAASKVRNFTWKDRQVGADETSFLLSFSRPMDQASVEQNLTIEPPLPGRFSWAGRRMAYTLNFPAPYGNEFKVSLPQAIDRFGGDRTKFTPFEASFQSRDRAFAYVGIDGDEQGRLMLYNLSTQSSEALTPQDLTVLDFQPYTQGDRVLFAAVDSQLGDQQTQQLYTVTTRLVGNQPSSSGQIATVLDSAQYQNLKFNLFPNG